MKRGIPGIFMKLLPAGPLRLLPAGLLKVLPAGPLRLLPAGLLKLLPLVLLVYSCEKIDPVYPDEPVIDYQGFSLFVSKDSLGNTTINGRLTFDFTDGDGNLGLYELDENTNPNLPDSLKYNFFLQLYDLQGYDFMKVPEEDGGILKYRIPTLDKNPTKGTMDLDISYPIIIHDTIFYTFYIVDRSFNRSNTDSSDVVVLSGIDLNNFEF